MRETRTEKNYISKRDFRKWVNAMYEQWTSNENSFVHYGTDGYIYVGLRSRVGVAKCNPSDKWDENIGIAYAWARCTGQSIYYEKEETYKPWAGEWVNVRTVNNCTRILVYITEGIDNYCFKTHDGHLILIDKDRVIAISPAK